MNSQTLHSSRGASPHGKRAEDSTDVVSMLNNYVASNRPPSKHQQQQQQQHRQLPPPQQHDSSVRISVTPVTATNEPAHRSHRRYFSRCAALTIVLLLLAVFALGALLINLTARVDILSDRVRRHDTIHATDSLFERRDSDTVSIGTVATSTTATQNDAPIMTRYGAQSVDSVRSMLHGRAAPPPPPTTDANEFERLLMANRAVDKSLDNTDRALALPAPGDEAAPPPSSSAVTLTPADLVRLFGVEVHHHEFAVWEPLPSATQGVRVPADGGIDYLSLERLLSFSVCCRVEVYLSTCPPTDQISTIVYRNPENDDNYLRVLVRNQVYFGKPCVFYWVQRPTDTVPLSLPLQTEVSEKTP